MTTLTGLQEAMTAFLREQGVSARSAWPVAERKVQKTPLAVVRVKEVEAKPAGFQNYLGEGYNPLNQTWTERYGVRAAVTFHLELYSPERRGEEGCRVLLDQVAGALQQGTPAGLSVEKWVMGETAFDPKSGMFRGKLLVVCRGLLLAHSQETGTFLGFEVKGGMKA